VVYATLCSLSLSIYIYRLNHEWEHNDGPFKVARGINRRYNEPADEESPDEDGAEEEEEEEEVEEDEPQPPHGNDVEREEL
jgi:hypothetical protein